MKVFTKKGYSSARMDDIVRESGLSKGAIYHHYNGKKDIFLALIEHWETQTFPDFYTRNGKERSASNTLRDFSREILKVFKNRSYVFHAEVEFWSLSNQDEDIRKRSQELYEKIINLFELVIKKGIREGEFIDDSTNPSLETWAQIDINNDYTMTITNNKFIIRTSDGNNFYKFWIRDYYDENESGNISLVYDSLSMIE